MSDWAVIGTDMFSYEDYPKDICGERDSCLRRAEAYNEEQKVKQPGGLSDRFRVLPLRDAVKRVDMSEEGFRAFVKAITHA